MKIKTAGIYWPLKHYDSRELFSLGTWYICILRTTGSNPRGGGGGGGHLRNFGLECAAGTLEPLAYTTASSAEFCYSIFLYRVNCLKTIPFTAARTYIAHIWKYPLPLPSFRVKPHYFWRFFSGTSKFSKHPRIGSDVFEVWCTY